MGFNCRLKLRKRELFKKIIGINGSYWQDSGVMPYPIDRKPLLVF
jgi:hypothetical protein